MPRKVSFMQSCIQSLFVFFSLTSNHTKVKEPSVPNNFLIVEGELFDLCGAYNKFPDFFRMGI